MVASLSPHCLQQSSWPKKRERQIRSQPTREHSALPLCRPCPRTLFLGSGRAQPQTANSEFRPGSDGNFQAQAHLLPHLAHLLKEDRYHPRQSLITHPAAAAARPSLILHAALPPSFQLTSPALPLSTMTRGRHGGGGRGGAGKGCKGIFWPPGLDCRVSDGNFRAQVASRTASLDPLGTRSISEGNKTFELPFALFFVFRVNVNHHMYDAHCSRWPILTIYYCRRPILPEAGHRCPPPADAAQDKDGHPPPPPADAAQDKDGHPPLPPAAQDEDRPPAAQRKMDLLLLPKMKMALQLLPKMKMGFLLLSKRKMVLLLPKTMLALLLPRPKMKLVLFLLPLPKVRL